MLEAYARVQVSDGRVVDLGPGDIIGRLDQATLRLNEPQISEAHALISLRGEQLVLLALRGALSVQGRPVSSVPLQPGLVIYLSQRSRLTVLHTTLPEEALGLVVDSRPLEVLRRSTYSLVADGSLVPRYLPDAPAHLWLSPEGWSFQTADAEEPRVLCAGERLSVAGHTLSVEAVPLERGGVAPTQALGALFPPILVVTRYETVHIHREGGSPPLQLSGIAARLISELASFGAPTPWRMLAEQLWSDESDPVILRQRLDRNLAKLRQKLRQAGLRADLIAASGGGDYELLLYPGDTLQEDG